MDDMIHSSDLEEEDLVTFRQLSAEIHLCHSKEDVSFEDAVKYHIRYMEFLCYLMDKYEIEDEQYFIDEVTGKVWLNEA